jgi:ATP-dependent Clp endopeptidase proteolytic subunit ClpP
MTSVEKDKTEDSGKKEETPKIIMLGGSEADIRTVAIYGDVTEELAKEAISGLWYLRSTAKTEEPIDIDDPETEFEETIRPIEVIISTNGGNADDMFAIYDAMRMCREEVEIETLGIGKVMSAGVLLLAAGTKGKRRIGKHCRIMIHSVIGGHIGPMHQLDNEMKEIKSIQELHIRALCEETNVTEKQLRALLKKKVNIYLTAEEAVKYGIADIVV